MTWIAVALLVVLLDTLWLGLIVLGPERLRGILNGDLGFDDVVVPDAAFEHDLKYADGVALLRELRAAGETAGITFGIKLSNTLEVENSRQVFDRDEMMYMSGRALHAVTTNLAHKLMEEFDRRHPSTGVS